MKSLYLFIVCFIVVSNSLIAQEEIALYKNGPTESNNISVEESIDKYAFMRDISKPRIYAYIAPKEIATGAAVLICPGGAYWGVSTDKEGTEIAAWFNKLGISAFVLYYRMPNGHNEIPLKDAQTALGMIHKGAKEWNLNKHKIGIIGFSAGGHLASTVGTHFTNQTRPDFMILVYPVISMKKEITHGGSRQNLIGKNPSEEMVNLYSNELQVSKNTPPTFLIVANDDNVVPAQNSILFYQALQANNVPSEIHTFDIGGHGFGMRKRNLEVDIWPDLLQNWLKTNKLIN
jgi:acetyl esterase/lipase